MAELPANTPITGKVKAWMEEKGFGFVTPDNGGPDVFVHRNQLSDGQSLQTGGAVVLECRLNVVRGKYEATTCSGAVATPVPGAAVPNMLTAAALPSLAAAIPGLGFAGVPGAAAAAAAAAALSGACAGAGGVAFRGGKGPGSLDNLFVAGLPEDISEDGVKELFMQYGQVAQCKVLPDMPEKPDRAALVRMGDENQAKWMVENLNGNIPLGMSKPLTVRYAGDRGVPAGADAATMAAYGKMLSAGTDNRFLPYGDVAGFGGAVGADQLGMAGMLGMDGQTFQTMQLLQSLQGCAGLGGMAGLTGLQPGLALGLDPAAAAAAAQTAAAIAAPEAAPAAGGGQWLEAQDPTSGKPYYYHSVTRETRWEKPPEMG